MKKLEEFKKDLPYQQAHYYLSFLLTDGLWEQEQILKASTSKYRKED